MRIALNLHGFTFGRGGVETYVTNLLRSLQKTDHLNEYFILCDRSCASDLRPEQANFQLKAANFSRPSPRWLLRGVFHRFLGYDLLTREFASLDVDVIHHPLTVLNPRRLSTPGVLTFHDMQQEYFPEFFSPHELRRRRSDYLLSTNEAKKIITISFHVKKCLVERYGIPPDKIEVIYHGYSDNYKPISDQENLERVKRIYALERPFLIYPAATWPHKNHLRLLAAIKVLIDRGRFDGELIFTGACMDAHSRVMSEISRLGLDNSVRFLGYVPNHDLPVLYSLARLMVFPSLFEGFGLPLVEAMACGCPVVCSNTTALPEVACDSAVYFDPASVESIAQELARLWDDDSELMRLRRKGLSRVRFFSWEKTAVETVDVYRSAVG